VDSDHLFMQLKYYCTLCQLTVQRVSGLGRLEFQEEITSIFKNIIIKTMIRKHWNIYIIYRSLSLESKIRSI